jgi:hypothetical protein
MGGQEHRKPPLLIQVPQKVSDALLGYNVQPDGGLVQVEDLRSQPERLRHRARAAFSAIALRCSRLSFLARAGPPFLPPSFPRATAAGFFLWRGFEVDSSVWSDSPVASSMMARASWLRSIGLDFLLDRLGRLVVCHNPEQLAALR